VKLWSLSMKVGRYTPVMYGYKTEKPLQYISFRPGFPSTEHPVISPTGTPWVWTSGLVFRTSRKDRGRSISFLFPIVVGFNFWREIFNTPCVIGKRKTSQWEIGLMQVVRLWGITFIFVDLKFSRYTSSYLERSQDR